MKGGPTREGRVAVRALRLPGGRPPLFLISAPGVNALGYVALARCLDPAESVFSVQAHGREYPARRDYTPDECAALAATYLAAVRARQPVGPYFFAGMCDGAHIAFEMARRLLAQGEEVALLAVIDTWPVENSSYYPLVVVESLRRRARVLSGRQRVAWAARALGQRVRRLGRALRARLPGGGPLVPAPAAVPGDRARWRSRVWPGPGFVPPRYGGRLTVLRVSKQPYWRLRDPSLGWAARAAEVDVRVIPGDHANLLRAPHVAVVARTLGSCLAAARLRAGTGVVEAALPRPA
ncbi:MAG: thioesterase domain-containing protein [Minicystis sp.]